MRHPSNHLSTTVRLAIISVLACLSLLPVPGLWSSLPQTVRSSNTVFKLHTAPHIIINPGLSCTVSAGQPHVSTSIYKSTGLTYMATHTYIACTENASSLEAVAILLYASPYSSTQYVMVARPAGVSTANNKSSLTSPQSNVQCNTLGTVGVLGYNYYATNDYGYIDGSYQDAYNNYGGAWYNCSLTVSAIASPIL